MILNGFPCLEVSETTSREQFVKVEDLKPYLRGVNIIVKVVSKTPVREVRSKRYYSTHYVCNVLVGDETGSVYMTLWDANIGKVYVGDTLRLKNGYVDLFRKSMKLTIGRYSRFETLEKSPIFKVNTENNLSDKRYERIPNIV